MSRVHAACGTGTPARVASSRSPAQSMMIHLICINLSRVQSCGLRVSFIPIASSVVDDLFSIGMCNGSSRMGSSCLCHVTEAALVFRGQTSYLDGMTASDGGESTMNPIRSTMRQDDYRLDRGHPRHPHPYNLYRVATLSRCQTSHNVSNIP